METSCLAVLVAAGQGNRFGRPGGKALAPLAGRPLFMHALSTLWILPAIKHIAVVVREDDRRTVEEHVRRLPPSGKRGAAPDKLLVVGGGETRQDSVRLGLEALALAGTEAGDVVLVHDAARPLASRALFLRVAGKAATTGAAVAPAIPVVDSLRAEDPPGSGATVPAEREGLWRIQTPQGCRFGSLVQAHRSAAAQGHAAQDDLALAQANGIEVGLVEGEESNLKVTSPADLRYAADVLTRGRAPRVGIGFDVHPLRAGGGVRLGGVLVPCEHELVGHSDADALAHAVTDALLGAAGGGDIGLRFPSSDERWRGADSIKLLGAVWDELAAQSYLVGNIDVTVLAEAPRLSPHFGRMQDNLAAAMCCESWRVNVKATTTEHLGSIGRGEGIAAMAVALLHAPGTETRVAEADAPS
ncbi:MAG: 2-C-methyl-D-erythritol 4-phosphate cytidylyltransferase [Bacillota bacterium]|nr:2-C-methyl-D-erythritol 4-phosphate cytidylyltransferase [Bacillota bacterium]